jgi:serine/threonine protein kinase/Tfp pilus assembly protein PilF
LRRAIECQNFLVDHPLLNYSLFLDGPQDEAGWPQPGDWFLGFELQQELGRGAFARVFLAKEPKLGGRLVVLKVSRKGGKEAETLGKINHPNIVPVHALHTDSDLGLTAVCMPYLGTATLGNVLQTAFSQGSPPRKAAPILEAARNNGGPEAPGASWMAPSRWLQKGTYVEGVCQVGSELAQALVYLHNLGIVHQDLKPNNVLLCPNGQPMLLDFNLTTETRLTGGTVPYMAPEQLLATTKRNPKSEIRNPKSEMGSLPPIDGRTDIFGLGVMLFQLFTGRHPFGPLQPAPIEEIRDPLLLRLRQPPLKARDYNPAVSPRLAQLLCRCLAFEVADRPRANEVAVALRRELSWWPHLRRHPGKMAALGLVVVLGLGGIGTGTAILAENLTIHPGGSVPVPVLMEEAETAYRSGQEEHALDCLDKVLSKDPSCARAFYLKGRIQQGHRDFATALISYQNADPQQEDALTQACIGFCLSNRVKHAEAIRAYERALQLGAGSARVYNDLAYSQMQLSLFSDAEQSLEKALGYPPPILQAVHHNRLALAYRQYVVGEVVKPLDKEKQALKSLPLTREVRVQKEKELEARQRTLQEKAFNKALSYLEQALNSGPGSTELFAEAARLFVQFREINPDWLTGALNYLERGAREGFDLSLLRQDGRLSPLWNEKRFREATEPRPGVKPFSLPTVRLVDPIYDRHLLSPPRGNP